MSVIWTFTLFIVGLGLVIFFAERLVKGLVGASLGFGLSAFLISVVFLGFDPENLAVGAAGAWEQAPGIALGSVVGACMVAVALAFGLTALIAPMRFEQASRAVLAVPPLAVVLLGGLALNRLLSRTDGVILLAAFAAAVAYLAWLSKRGASIEPGGEVGETLEKGAPSRWRALGLLVVSLAAIVIGSEMLVHASQTVIKWLGVSGTFFGMVVVALAVSIEEVARELPAAWKGRPEISYGNVAGSVLAFFLFNAGIIALVRPIDVDDSVLYFYLPVCLATVTLVSVLMMGRRVGRWAGIVLVLLYLGFVIGGYVLFGSAPGGGD